MCGICGVINFDGSPVDPRVLHHMTDAIAHRGPDGEGWYCDKNVGFGHRRLATIDLSPAGDQPMVTPDGRYALTYNGEIYNFRELRSVLEERGHKFQSNSDSEVVLYAWAEWGKDCVVKFNGMFAFAVWDSLKEELYLVRDRFGIKPVYYAHVGRHLAFGSEQRAIMTLPGFVNTLDEDALVEYFTFQNILSDRTLAKGLRMLPPGQILVVDCKGFVRALQYWDPQFSEPDKRVDEAEYQEELRRLLTQAVVRQLVTDVEVGTYLSGGIDSGTIVAIGAMSLPSIKTFTCGFDMSFANDNELNFDERVQAEAISSLFKTEHYEIVLNSSDMERCLDEVVLQIEEPRVGQSYPNYLIARLASKMVKVVMSGTGGDELFGGYPWRYYRAHTHSSFDSFINDHYLTWHRLVDGRRLRKLLDPIWKLDSDDRTRDIFRGVFLSHQNELKTPADYVNHCLYFEAKTFLHGLLVVEDKLSMANGLETRVPFLDNDLVSFAAKCPANLKLPGFFSGHWGGVDTDEKSKALPERRVDGKSILREAARQILPERAIRAPKQGFSSPDSSWFRGESSEFVNKRLGNVGSPIYQYLDYREAQSLLQEHKSGSSNWRLLLWSMLSLNSLLSR